MSSCNEKIFNMLKIFGKNISVCTVTGNVINIDRTEYNVYNNELHSSKSVHLSIISIKYNNISEDVTIDKLFNGKIGDKVVITYIKSHNNAKFNVSIVNLDSGQAVSINNVSNVVDHFDRKEKIKKILLEGTLGLAVMLFICNQIGGEPMYNIQHEVIASRIILITFFLLMSFFTKIDIDKKRTQYSMSIRENIDNITEKIKCPILFKSHIDMESRHSF